MSGLDDVRREELAEALHAAIDGDFLIGAERWGQSDVPMDQAGAAGLVRWASDALAPLIDRWLTAARTEAAAEVVARVEAVCERPWAYDFIKEAHEPSVLVRDIRAALSPPTEGAP